MTDEELNKKIHEIMGLCWHIRSTNECIVCHRILVKSVGGGNFECLPANIDFVNAWEGFGIPWKFIQEQEYIKKLNFRDYIWSKLIGHGDWSEDLSDADAVPETIISPLALAKAFVEFFEEKKD